MLRYRLGENPFLSFSYNVEQLILHLCYKEEGYAGISWTYQA